VDVGRQLLSTMPSASVPLGRLLGTERLLLVYPMASIICRPRFETYLCSGKSAELLLQRSAAASKSLTPATSTHMMQLKRSCVWACWYVLAATDSIARRLRSTTARKECTVRMQVAAGACSHGGMVSWCGDTSEGCFMFRVARTPTDIYVQ
jgi:hypothetical protein